VEASGALEVGGNHRLQLLHHAQPPLHSHYIVRQAIVAKNVAVETKFLDELWCGMNHKIKASGRVALLFFLRRRAGTGTDVVFEISRTFSA